MTPPRPTELSPITELLDRAILADLAGAVDPLLDRVGQRAAAVADTRQLLAALLPLARVARYSDVRGTQGRAGLAGARRHVRAHSVGLRAACASLDDDAAEQMLAAMGQAHQAIGLLARDDLREEWLGRLEQLAAGGIHGLIRGWCCRLLREEGRIDEGQLADRTRLALSLVNGAAEAAAWLSGLLRGSGLLLLHQDGLWEAVDRWLTGLSSETFTEMLPLVRLRLRRFHAARAKANGREGQTPGEPCRRGPGRPRRNDCNAGGQHAACGAACCRFWRR